MEISHAIWTRDGIRITYPPIPIYRLFNAWRRVQSWAMLRDDRGRNAIQDILGQWRNTMNASLTYSLILILILVAGSAAAEAATEVNLAPVAEPSTSHVSRDTSLAALHDGHAPKASNSRGKGAYGNWPTKGTQWVQYDWAAPVCTRKIDVFWWADGGGIDVPKAYRVLYWDGKGFVPVRNPSGLGGAKDKFNTTTFDEVRTSKLRLEIDSTKRSTGILEWKVYNEGKLPNLPPSVAAGADRIVMSGRKTPFAGQLLRAIDTTTTKVKWSKTSGPGKVVFDNPGALATMATFSAVGAYVLTLAAHKGDMSDSSTVAVRVVAKPQLDIRAAGKTGVRITIQPCDVKDGFPYTPALVERDYPNLYKKFTSVGPLLEKMGNGGKGIAWETSEEVELLGALNYRVTEEGISKGQPAIESDVDKVYSSTATSLAPSTDRIDGG